MSLLALSLAVKQQVGDPLAKLILILIANRHNDHTGECYPSLGQIQAETELTMSTVTRKLNWLEEQGLIRRSPRADERGGSLTTAYDLLFVPLPEDRPGHRPKRKTVVPEDWRPKPETVDKLRRRYPHHVVDEDFLTRDFVQWTRAKGVGYVDHEAAFTNSAERYLRRQTPAPTQIERPWRDQHRSSGGVVGAVGRLFE